MTGPEWMTFTAALQVGGLAALRVAVPLYRRQAPARFWGRSSVVEGLFIPVFATISWWDAAGQAVAVLIALALWWHSRRMGRKRAASLLGAKSKALRDSLVRRARQAGLPRPVLIPGGAR